MNEKLERTRASYDRLALGYRERRRDRSAIAVDVNAFVAKFEPGQLVLDVGCGPGFDSAVFRERGLRVVGLDRSWGMLCSGVEEWPGPRAQADMRALPIRRAVHGLWASASMLHVEREDVPGTLSGFHRVLVPGGWLYLSLKEGDGAAWDDKYGREAPRWFTYWTGAAVDSALETAGFDVRNRLDQDLNGQRWIVRIARAVESGSEEA